MRLRVSLWPKASLEELGESFNANKVLTRSCVILNMGVVSVRFLYQYPSVLTVYRKGKTALVSETS